LLPSIWKLVKIIWRQLLTRQSAHVPRLSLGIWGGRPCEKPTQILATAPSGHQVRQVGLRSPTHGPAGPCAGCQEASSAGRAGLPPPSSKKGLVHKIRGFSPSGGQGGRTKPSDQMLGSLMGTGALLPAAGVRIGAVRVSGAPPVSDACSPR
jgi:hypothetical protein